MTDLPSSPNDPEDDDLLASLYLDGEATPAERVRVETDPVLMARVQSFEAIALELSSVTPPANLSSTQIAAALDLFDQQLASPITAEPSDRATASPVSGSKVSSLAARRERKQARGIPTWLSVAAAAALVVGGLGFVSTLGSGGDDSSVDAAMDAPSDPAASSTNRDNGALSTEAASTAETTASADGEVMEEEAMEMAADDSADEAMEDDAMEEEAGNEEASTDQDFDDGADDSELGPIPLDQLEATTAAGYLALLSDHPLQPIANSPCAESPLINGLFGVDSFLPVVFNGVVASLLVQEGVPSTAVIVGPTCKIELE